MFANQKIQPSPVIISFILMTLTCDSGVILRGEIRCWSLLGFKGLIKLVKKHAIVPLNGNREVMMDTQAMLTVMFSMGYSCIDCKKKLEGWH